MFQRCPRVASTSRILPIIDQPRGVPPRLMHRPPLHNIHPRARFTRPKSGLSDVAFPKADEQIPVKIAQSNAPAAKRYSTPIAQAVPTSIATLHNFTPLDSVCFREIQIPDWAATWHSAAQLPQQNQLANATITGQSCRKARSNSKSSPAKSAGLAFFS